MANNRPPTAVAAAPPSRGPRYIGTEQDAAEAFGEGSELYHWAVEFVRRPPSGPVTLTPANDAAAAAPLRIADLFTPGWHTLELSYDPQRSSVLRCAIDGEPVPLERGADGFWRPRRTGRDG